MIMKKFAAIGEAMIELSHQTERTLAISFAGDTLNTSLYLARVLPPAQTETYYVTALGNDHYSNMMLHDWQQENINTTLVARLADKLPGLYLIRNDEKGERYFSFYRSQSAARELFKGDHISNMCKALIAMDYLYLSAITLAILDEASRDQLLATIKLAKQQGAQIFFDSNYRPALWPDVKTTQEVIKKFAPHVDIILPTFSDEQAIFNDASPQACAQRYHQWGIKEVIMKRDVEPCLVSTPTGQTFVTAEPVAKVIDATGAGDSFNAAYIAARLQNIAPEQAAKYGHQLASVVIQHKGAIIPKEFMPKLF
jgi:2-dehydro-3-deoxygluconokinase